MSETVNRRVRSLSRKVIKERSKMSMKPNPVGTFCRPLWRQWLWVLLIATALTGCSTPQTATVAQAPTKLDSTLGTQWGEGRESVVRTVKVERLNPDRPQTLARLRYSDEASIRQALGRDSDRQLNLLLADGNLEWSVQDGRGNPLPIFSVRDQDYQVAGRDGERYELVYINRSNRYYEIVATVDGLDVLTGQPGSVRNSGYLLYPGQTLRIDGFRKSQREVAAFRFSSKDRAYASNTPAGDARNIGVIGSAVFEVRVNDPDTSTRRSHTPGAQPGTPNPFPDDPAARPYAPPPEYR
ncbi:MAG: hypothetical protein LBE33_04085 [Zoogloeaceae bacterium]|jgi:hypothetical protein|nr:hypothetical protein [Zoogloeaceae bacterium]